MNEVRDHLLRPQTSFTIALGYFQKFCFIFIRNVNIQFAAPLDIVQFFQIITVFAENLQQIQIVDNFQIIYYKFLHRQFAVYFYNIVKKIATS